MNKLVYILMCALFSWQITFAQIKPVADTVVIQDHQIENGADSDEEVVINLNEDGEEMEAEKSFRKPTLRVVTSDSIKNIARQKDFAYMQYIDSFYRNKKAHADIQKEKEVEKTSGSIFDMAGIRMIYWALALFAVLFLVYKIFLSNNALFTKNRSTRPAMSELQEVPVNKDNISQLLENAIKEKNYRLAIRLMYLQTIALMGDKQLLNVSPQKTNYQYVQELSGTPLQQAFSKLTMQYEYAWFGGFAVSSPQFEDIYSGYNNLKSQI